MSESDKRLQRHWKHGYAEARRLFNRGLTADECDPLMRKMYRKSYKVKSRRKVKKYRNRAMLISLAGFVWSHSEKR